MRLDNLLVGFGSNEFGALGNLNFTGQQFLPFPVNVSAFANQKISLISAGPFSSMIVLENDDLYTFGYNQYNATGTALPTIYVQLPTKVTFEKNTSSKIIQIEAALASHVLTDDGWIYSAGRQYMYENVVEYSTFRPIFRIPNAIKISCKFFHCIVLTSDGNVFVFGQSKRAQHGTGHNPPARNITTTTHVKFDLTGHENKKPIDVAAGPLHNLVLFEDGRM